MDINFHYYAVKTLAIHAGFDEECAQIIARYSQFVDDFTIYKTMVLDNVPTFARHLAKPYKGKWLFTPVTTGFDSWFEMARLALEQNQRNITIPFHFIPPHTKLNEVKTGDERTAWRVVPAKMDLGHLICGLLTDAKDKFIHAPQATENLMRIGILLHIFADTYAHQNFSGFWDWENYCELTGCRDENGQDITSKYSPSIYHRFPAIGHTEANHAPDDSNISFELKMMVSSKDKYTYFYGRSNVSEFCVASYHIINYLSDCLGNERISSGEWERLCETLGRGFKTSWKSTMLLNSHWGKLFPGINYRYEKEEMMNGMLSVRPVDGPLSAEMTGVVEQLFAQGIELDPVLYATKSDDFFHYNVIADEVRNFVNGKDVGREQRMALCQALDTDMSEADTGGEHD